MNPPHTNPGQWSGTRWAHAICASDLPPTTRHVALCMALFMDNVSGDVVISAGKLAKYTGLTERSIGSHRALMVKHGWLRQKRVGGIVNGRRVASEYTADYGISFRETDSRQNVTTATMESGAPDYGKTFLPSACSTNPRESEPLSTQNTFPQSSSAVEADPEVNAAGVQAAKDALRSRRGLEMVKGEAS